MRDATSHSDPRDWRAEIAERLASLRLAPEEEADLADELAQHLEDRFRELRVRGESEASARRAVLEELDGEGNLAAKLQDVVRRGVPSAAIGTPARGSIAAQLRQDIRYATRTMRRAPGFTAVVILTLALGIGAATTIFSLVNGVLLKPLPYRDPDQLVVFYGTSPEKQLAEVDFPPGLFVAIRDKSRTFASMAAFEPVGFTITGTGEPVRIDAATVSLDFFRVFGTQPLLGRTFVTGEDRPDDNRVSVISYGLWQRMFGGDSGILGRVIRLNGNPSTIVGVMPPEFAMPDRAELWVPLWLDPTRFNCWCLDMVGRMRPGVSGEGARADIVATIDAFALSRRDVFPDHKPDDHAKVIVTPLVNRIAGDVRTPLLILIAAVGVLLLIACANIANLLLARAAVRNREMAVRCCLGASPRRIATQLLTENLLLAGAGAALGLLFSVAALRLIRRLPEDQIPRMDQVRLDPIVLLFAIGVTAACALMFGLAPALRAARVDLQTNLKDGSRGSASGSARRLSNAFVVVQFALSLVLLAGAGLAVRSFEHLVRIDPGFRTANVLTFNVSLPAATYPSSASQTRFFRDYTDRIQQIPGVVAAGAVMLPPVTSDAFGGSFTVVGRPEGSDEGNAQIRSVTPGYLKALSIPLLAGRDVRAQDGEDAPHVALISESAAQRYWPGENPVGKQLRVHVNEPGKIPREIVGVVGDVRTRGMDVDPVPVIYVPHAQYGPESMTIAVRTAGDPTLLLPQLRAALAVTAPGVAMSRPRSLDDLVALSVAEPRFRTLLLSLFAVVSLVLAAVGLYGVVAFSVNERKTELGLRIALGADPRDVLRLVLREGMQPVFAGIVCGLAGALVVGRVMRTLLFGVDAFDPVTFAGVAVTLAGVALAACYVPARRAMRVDPAGALR